METITFNTEGGPLVAEVSSGFAQPGFYVLQLWNAGVNQVVMREQGNFINDDDDAYTLPTPNELNDGRVIQAVVTLTILPLADSGDPQYNVTLTLSQDGAELGKVSVSNTTTQHTVLVNVFATLQQASQG